LAGLRGGRSPCDWFDAVAQQLDIAHRAIQPNLGAATCNFSPQSLEDIPHEDNAPLDQVLFQAPAVAQASFGQIHLRGEHASVEYRLNGVDLPEGLFALAQKRLPSGRAPP
jgi:hypothetical protein